MDVTMNASNTSHGILINVVPLDILLLVMEGHFLRRTASRPDRHSSDVIYFCPPLHQIFILWQSPFTPPRYPLNLHLLMPQEWRMICSCIGVSSWIFDGPTLWPALWTSRLCSVGPVLLLLYSLTLGMDRLGAGPMKLAWIAMPFTLWEVLSTLTVFSRFLILPYRRVVKVPG